MVAKTTGKQSARAVRGATKRAFPLGQLLIIESYPADLLEAKQLLAYSYR